MLTVLLSSPRVAPGLLTWQAWSALRAASRVLAGSAGHSQLPALTAAGVIPEIVELPPDAAGQAASLAAAAEAADGPVVWLAPEGEGADAELLAGLSAAGTQVRVLAGAHEPPGAHLLDLVSIMDTLRVSCPWDREQTHASLVRYLLEEAYEAVETVEDGDLASLREELGDVLLQVLFHSRIAAEHAAEDGGFTIDDVADTLAAKLIRRHPHVFGSTAVSSAADVNRNWEEIKKAERSQRSAAVGGGPPSVLDGVPFGQPALSLAAQLQRRAERAGMPVVDGEPTDIGEELMRVVARARAAGLDPELELRTAARRFAEQVRSWERSGGDSSAPGSPHTTGLVGPCPPRHIGRERHLRIGQKEHKTGRLRPMCGRVPGPVCPQRPEGLMRKAGRVSPLCDIARYRISHQDRLSRPMSSMARAARAGHAGGPEPGLLRLCLESRLLCSAVARCASLLQGFLGAEGTIRVEAVINEMRAAVAPGQQDLDAAAVSRLRELTARLVAGRREEARTEYERFLSVIKRELCLPRDRLAELLDGAVILVTGGTGCVGSTLITQLAAFRPARIVSVSRGVTRDWPRHPGAEYLYADVRDQARMEALIGEIRPDLIFHVASQRDPGLAETLVHHTVTTNVLGTRSVLGAAAAAGTGQVVCASTGKALRPFSPDVYTASKRVAEWVAFGFAASGALPVSAVRFTHVVDNSIIHQRLQDWAASSAVIRLHSPQIAFYVQSAVESAQLLLLAALDQGPGRLPIRAIADLGWPVSLLDLTLGVLAARDSDAPVYLSGYDPGYEEVPFPGLYDPATAGDLSPLLNAFEAAAVVPSECPMTNVFDAEFAPEPRAAELSAELDAVCGETDEPQRVRAALRELSWALLDATLAVAPPRALTNAARIANRHVATLTTDHHQILQTIQKWGTEGSNLAATGEASR